MTLALAIDVLLMGMLIWLAWSSLSCVNLFRGVVLFIVFGLLMALAWARLQAPDIALAEAAIGAGLTGLLLLNAVHSLRGADPDRAATRLAGAGQAIALIAVIIGLAAVIAPLVVEAPGLAPQVITHLPDSGVSHPVTAVLLNFRGYDTLLEVAVLMLALRGAAIAGGPTGAAHGGTARAPVFQALVRHLLPVIVLVSGYLLWRGASAPGGAFQAAALLAGGGVLLHLAGRWRPPPRAWVGILAGAGFALFLLLAMWMVFAAGGFLTYPRDLAGSLILLIETVLTASIGLILLLLIIGPAHDDGKPPA